jgi:hypothetical protein
MNNTSKTKPADESFDSTILYELVEKRDKIEKEIWRVLIKKTQNDGLNRCKCKGNTFYITDAEPTYNPYETYEICLKCGGIVEWVFIIKLARDGFVLWDKRMEQILAKTTDPSIDRDWRDWHNEITKRSGAIVSNNAHNYMRKQKSPFPLDNNEEVDL